MEPTQKDGSYSIYLTGEVFAVEKSALWRGRSLFPLPRIWRKIGEITAQLRSTTCIHVSLV
jgi:hypothetical protein